MWCVLLNGRLLLLFTICVMYYNLDDALQNFLLFIFSNPVGLNM